MPRSLHAHILPSLAGESRRMGFQQQDVKAFTHYHSQNMWPTDVLSGRMVNATRPPLVPFANLSGSVNMLSPLNGVAPGKPLRSLVAADNGQLYWYNGTEFVAATGPQASNIQTGTSIFAWPFLQKLYIPKFGSLPHVFDYITGEVDYLDVLVGDEVEDLRFFVVWQGALWGGGSLIRPNMVFASRVGNPQDWNFAVPISDQGGAFFTGGENQGLLRGPVTALIPFNQDTMFSSTTEGWVAFRGHPRQTQFTTDLNIPFVMGQGAWDIAPNGTLYVFTREGLLGISGTENNSVIPISRNALPEDLVGLPYDYENPNVFVRYDGLYHGLYITVRDPVRPQAWFFDLNANGFHRMTFSDYPMSMANFNAVETGDQSGVIWGRSDGLHRFDRLGVYDHPSSIGIGPFPISDRQDYKNIVQRSSIVFGSGQPVGKMRFITGRDAQHVVDQMESDNVEPVPPPPPFYNPQGYAEFVGVPQTAVAGETPED